MAVTAQVQQQTVPFETPQQSKSVDLAKLAALHAEAEETARLANLLGRTAYIAGTIAVVAVVASLTLSNLALPATLAWAMLSLAGVAALLIAYARTMRAPFERAALLSFREDLKAVLLYAGFAWGAGGWLLLPYDASAASVVAFAALPVGAIAALIKDRDTAFMFGVPIAGLVSFASVLRPFSDAGLDAALILIACGAIGAAVLSADRVAKAAQSLPFFKQIQA
jgi:hypothetical protein